MIMLQKQDVEILESSLPFWDKLNVAQRDLLVSNAKLVHYTTGHSMLSDRNECVGVLIVKSGTLRTYITSDEGREITLYRIEAGDMCILSASCVLKTIDFDVSMDAQSECDIIEINSVIFSQLFDANMYVQLCSYKLATERFSDVMWAMQQILFTSFDKRLASFILDESIKVSNDTISFTHEEIAKYLGSAREVVSRMLKYFSNEGMVKLSRGKITITNKGRLRDML